MGEKTVNEAYDNLSNEEKQVIEDTEILRALYTARLIVIKHSKVHAERAIARRQVERMKKKYNLFGKK